MNIVIVTNNPFPVGLAPTNRIINYCKGFLLNNCTPLVLIYKPTENYLNVRNRENKGKYQDIKFLYPGKTSIRSASFFKRRIQDLTAFFSSIIYLFKFNQQYKIDAVLVYTKSIWAEPLFIFASFIMRIKIIKEESENPNVYFPDSKNFFQRLKKSFYIKYLYRLYDGVLIMTSPLKDFFVSLNVNETKLAVIPQTVDTLRFKLNNEQKPYNFEYIAYTGSLKESKDGVLSLIEAYSIINKKVPGLYLLLIGSGTKDEVTAVQEKIKALNLSSKIILTGQIDSGDVSALICNAKILVSCRPKGLQSNYGFPTKVVEYLAAGVPVITTVAGDLEKYLIDNVNAFIAKSSDPVHFSNKILEVLENYNDALVIGKAGRKLVEENFSNLEQTRKILKFLKLYKD